ncbi:MAG TPA: hypothetical protein VKB88_00835, partial [Bryobacteraceae bacterium]|nr:hypothetical protein [Bryobacteraceae bacterium]
MRLEELSEIDDLQADAVSHRPTNGEEMEAVGDIVLAQMQILRGLRLEPGLFTTALDSAADSKGRPFTALSLAIVDGNMPLTGTQDRSCALTEGLRRLTAQSNSGTSSCATGPRPSPRRGVEELERLRPLSEPPSQTNPFSSPNPNKTRSLPRSKTSTSTPPPA